MSNPFSLSVVVASQKSTPPNELGLPDELKMEGLSFWKERPGGSLSGNELESLHHNHQFSRAESQFSQVSDLFKKKILENDFDVKGPMEKSPGEKSSLRETRPEPPVLNPNLVRHVNFNIPEPCFHDLKNQFHQKELKNQIMDRKFEKKCRAIVQQACDSSSNVFSFHKMKADLRRPKRFSQARPFPEMLRESSPGPQKCIYTDLFLTSKSRAEAVKEKKSSKKTHVNLSKISIKKEATSIHTCKVPGSRRGLRKELAEKQLLGSRRCPQTDPRQVSLRNLPLSKPIFVKLNGFFQGSPVLSVGRDLSRFVFTNERKLQGKVKLNYAMTPDLRLGRVQRSFFQTPNSRRPAALNSQKSIRNKKLFLKAKTMLDLERVFESKEKKTAPKKRPKNSKSATPKAKRKTIKKKRAPAAKRKKKGGCRCKKTHCTRLHCICFRDKGFCDESCSCANCYNRPRFGDMISHIRELTQEINPLAFKSKIQVIETQSGQKIHNRGCSCTKNHCKKNYCECFKNGLPCSPLCKCENCQNSHVDLEAEEVKRIFKKCSRKKKKFIIAVGDKDPQVHNIQMA